MELLHSSLLEQAGFAHGFSLGTPVRSCTDDSPQARRAWRDLAAAVAPSLPVVRLVQEHGDRVVAAADAARPSWDTCPTEAADAAVALDTEAACAVVTADCAPILLADPATGRVAAVHAGWRGLAGRVVRNAVMALCAEDPRRLLAAIGPCICSACYEVDWNVASRFPETWDPHPDDDSRYLLDIGAAAEVALIAAGLTSDRIENLGVCTSCGPHPTHSYRRDKGDCGRQLSAIATRIG